MGGVIVLLATGWVLAPGRAELGLAGLDAVRRHRRSHAERAGLAEFCTGVARSLEVGETLVRAMATASANGVLAAPIREALRRHHSGEGWADVVAGWAESDGGADAALVAAATRLAAGPVGAQPELFDEVAATLRRRVALAAEARAQSAQARISMWVIASLPWVMGIVVVAERGSAADFLLGTPAGWTCICAALALEVLGAIWMRRIVGRVER